MRARGTFLRILTNIVAERGRERPSFQLWLSLSHLLCSLSFTLSKSETLEQSNVRLG